MPRDPERRHAHNPRKATRSPSLRAPSFFFKRVSVKGKMLNLGRAGTWSLSSLQPLSQRERQPCRTPCRIAGPPCLPPCEGQSLRGQLLDFVKRGAANLPASARLESLGKVLGASRKWLFGCPRHCSTFLDADPIAQEPFQRTGLGQLFLEPAATDVARQQQSQGTAASPRGSSAPRRGGGCGPEAGAMPWLPPAPGACFQSPSTAFSARLLPMFELLSAPSGPKSARPERAAHRLGPYGDLRTRSRGCGHSAPSWSHSSQAGRNLCPPPGLSPSSDPAPWDFVLRLTERAGEEASGRSTSSVGKHVCPLLLSVSPNPFFLFPGYLSLGKKKSLSSLAKAFLLFPRQTAKWL